MKVYGLALLCLLAATVQVSAECVAGDDVRARVTLMLMPSSGVMPEAAAVDAKVQEWVDNCTRAEAEANRSPPPRLRDSN